MSRPVAPATEPREKTIPAPPDAVILAAAKLAYTEWGNVPLYLDYYPDSVIGSVKIGVRDDKSMMLIKSDEEYTSNIEHTKQMVRDKTSYYIIKTENSVYVTLGGLPKVRVKADAYPDNDEA